MAHLRRFDHIGITVADLDWATAFFVRLGLEVEGTGSVEGEFVETVCGLEAAVDAAAADGYGLVGGIGEYENSVRMAYVRGPEGIIVSLFGQIG